MFTGKYLFTGKLMIKMIDLLNLNLYYYIIFIYLSAI